MSSASARRLGEISLELLNIAAGLNKCLRVLGDDEQANKTLEYIRAKGLSSADVYNALVDLFGPYEKPQEAVAP